MSNELPGLIVPLEARVDKLEKGLERANRSQRRAAQQMERRAKQSARRIETTYGRMGDGIAAGFKKMALPVLGAAGLAGIAQSALQSAKAVAQIGDEAKRAGVNLKSFQEWKFVAEQNRIGVDAMVDGLKELNLRADEFIETGKGPAAEAFDRLGYSATDLSKGLEDPSELLLEIIGRMEKLSVAARIRVADEVFGGSAGERFVELVDRGEDGLRNTVNRAHELGLVLDDSVIARADELDRKFDALMSRVATLGKRIAVETAQIGADMVDDLASIGDGPDPLAPLNQTFDQLEGKARAASTAMLQSVGQLQVYGYHDIANEMRDLANRAGDLVQGFADGTIEGEQFAQELETIQSEAQAAFDRVEEIDRADFPNVMAALAGLATQLVQTMGVAQSLKGVLDAIDGSTASKSQLQVFREADAASRRNFEADQERRAAFLKGEADRNAMTQDRLDLEREITSVTKRAADEGVKLTRLQAEEAAKARIAADEARRTVTDASDGTGATGGGSGGGADQSDWNREIEDIAEETAALRIEAEELAKVTGEQLHRADAMDLARAKADLLNAALRSGMADTPELRAQIEELAVEYTDAAGAAELASNRIGEVQEASQRGARAVASVFEGMATGALSAREAVGRLILEMIKLSLQKRLMDAAQNAAGTGSWFGKLITLVGGGFSGGGWTGPGGKYEPAGVVHRDEFVFSKEATSAIGVANLDAMHRAAKRGYADGGLVGGKNTLRALPQGSAAPQIAINAPVTVNGSAGTPEQNANLAEKMAREMESTLRGVVVDELRRQMRPGNMLSRRQ